MATAVIEDGSGSISLTCISLLHKEDCYISRLTVRRVGLEDSKEYILNVENKHGNDMVPVILKIKGKIVCYLNESFQQHHE